MQNSSGVQEKAKGIWGCEGGQIFKALDISGIEKEPWQTWLFSPVLLLNQGMRLPWDLWYLAQGGAAAPLQSPLQVAGDVNSASVSPPASRDLCPEILLVSPGLSYRWVCGNTTFLVFAFFFLNIQGNIVNKLGMCQFVLTLLELFDVPLHPNLSRWRKIFLKCGTLKDFFFLI